MKNEVQYAVEMDSITMIFNKTLIANDKIDFRVKKGEIHALVGENGAGKSTLMSILFGLYEPTQGEIKINGKMESISSPVKANQLGIGMVHQHFKLVDIYPVWMNIALGDEITKAKLFLDKNKIKAKITEIMEKYHLEVDLDAKIEDITVGMQQRTEILKILYRSADILVFDEPTAVLTPIEIKGLLDVMRKLQKDGKTIIFITHKMSEIQAVANSATVIRRGKKIETFDMSKTTIEKLAEAMVGRKLVEVKNNYTPCQDKVVLKIENLTMKKLSNHKVIGLENFSLDIHAGEIVAIAGVEGNGQQELVGAISGLEKVSQGTLFLNNEDITKASIKKRYQKYKINHIPEDRHKHGLVLENDIIQNMVLQNIDDPEFSRFGIMKKNAIQSYAQKIIAKFDVRGSQNGFAISRQLSGGNQQKAIVGRELSRDHNLIIIFQPTRGLDVGSIEFIHNEILKEKEKGKAVLLVSYELSEVMALADRIVILNGGKKIGEVPGKGAKREEIGLMMTGKGAT
ncbi:ribose/galactose ABC transporter ATP-binding protein [Spiroplasma sabaudiense Ar-1343]|uniref:Ribose/galactose ABC transporter ATP-binding protein n=1 Tax=Spiroplasma sabaudiense Ar-1343 TaxID=1276257 RepID=W6A947_9MOLU|nr:ABC transporter ATP-binding protein [Spiroplasma sabaudiense]AHI53491.1 ribose/galactose ABC transporter ATP-binding protein [Spiroplasma sabaudiense Ar-1343]